MLSKFRLLCLYSYKFFENYVLLAKGEEGDILLLVWILLVSQLASMCTMSLEFQNKICMYLSLGHAKWLNSFSDLDPIYKVTR